jgi:radical SAM protein with 4Fe4S-binding SPASM domain
VVFDIPQVVSWNITYRCNLSCLHCYSDSGSHHTKELSLSKIQEIVNMLSDYEVFQITLTGGEPLMRTDIFDIIEYACRRDMIVNINSNGTLITEKKARKLKESGISQARISLDGACAATHDAFRGVAGSFEKAVEAVTLLRTHKIPVDICTIPNLLNFEEVEKIIIMALQLGVERHYFFRFVPSGRGLYNKRLILPKDSYLNLLRDTLAFSRTLHSDLQIHWEDPLSIFYANGQFLLEPPPGHFGCSAGTVYLGITPEGYATPCPSLPYSVGDLKKTDLLSLWNCRVLQQLRNRTYTNCSDCPYKQQCGGCRSMAYATSGDLFGKDPFCPLHNGGEKKWQYS